MSLESLEFLLDLDAKIDGMMGGLDAIDKSIKALHTLDKTANKVVDTTKHVEKASHGAAGAHGKHGHAVWQLGHQYEEAKKSAVAFAEAAGLVLAYEVIEKLVDKVKELGEEMVHVAAKAERTDTSFKLLLGEKGGEEMLEYLEELHKHTEFSKDALQGLAGSFLRVGFAGEGLKYAVAAAADLAALPGGNLDAAATSLEQAKRTGRVEGRTLRGLGFGEEDFLSQLAKRTGKSAEVLKKEMEKGKVDADQSLGALYDLIRKRTGAPLGDAAETMSKGMAAKLTHLKEVPEELFEELRKSPAWERLKGLIDNITVQLDPKSPMGLKFFEAMDKGLTRLVDAIDKIDMNKLVDDFSHLVERLPAVIDLLIGAAKALLYFGKVTVWVYEHTVPGQILKNKLTPTYERDGAKLHETAARALDTVKPSDAGGHTRAHEAGGANLHDVTSRALDTVKPLDAATQMRNQLWPVGKHGAEGLAAGLTHAIPKVKKAVAELGAETSGGLEDELEVDSPSRVFKRIGMMSGQGYLDGLDASMSRLPDSVPAGAFARPVAPGGAAGGGPIQVTVHIETHVNGHDGGSGAGGAEELGQQVAAHVESILPGALQSAFQRMQQESGS
jgi:tape measure domain-containing protein